jgi:hypothetical protein
MKISVNLGLLGGNMLSMSTAKYTLSSRNLIRTPTWLFVRSGPCSRVLFSEVFSNSAEASNTVLSFPGLFGLNTGKWGRYHFLGPDARTSSGERRRAQGRS